MEEKDIKQETELLNQEEQPPQKWYNAMPDRSCFLFIIAGAYLGYTGYSLVKNYLDGVEGGSIGFAVAGVAFILIAAGMLFLGGRGWLRNDKIKKLQQEAEEKAEASVSKASLDPKTGMSIQERANLAKSLHAQAEDAVEETGNEQESAEE